MRLKWRDELRVAARRSAPSVLAFTVCAIAAMLIAAPAVWQRAVQEVRFNDTLGTFPVRVSLCRDGRSTLDTGLFGKVYWDKAGPHGYSVYARAIGPPEAGGDLASYIDPRFVQANVILIDDPDVVVRAYSERFADGLRDRLLRDELLAGVFGGTVLFLIVPRRRLREIPAAQSILVSALLISAASAVSTLMAVQLFASWPCSHPPAAEHAMPGMGQLSFSSPQTLEVAQQVKPFIDKNLERIGLEAQQFESAAETSLARQIRDRGDDLAPRPDETLIAAEADPQGSFVGVRVRTRMYAELAAELGPAAISMRTISGDVSSNGTIAESGYIARESRVSPRIPTVAVGGDHDSANTWRQMEANDVILPDLNPTKVSGLRVIGANDRERKTLFGGIITNPSGISEQQLGERLRGKVPTKPAVVLLHQPDAAAGFLGFTDLSKVRKAQANLIVPHDDGIPDQPPGVVNIGHLHQADGPWVLWNTDGHRITWTVVNQLGTAGGVENRPTFNRFSTPNSAPLEPLAVRLEYVNRKSGLQTGYADIICPIDGQCTVGERVDVGLPGGQPEIVVESPTPSPEPSDVCNASPPASPSLRPGECDTPGQ